MDQQPLMITQTPKFSGQHSDTDPKDCQPGSMFLQINMMSVVNGILTTRGGLKEITLDVLE